MNHRITPAALLAALVMAPGARQCAAQTVASLFSFDNSNGASPNSLLQSPDGSFLGTTYGGGLNNTACSVFGCGVIFRFLPGAGLQVLYRFRGWQDGSNPVTGLIPASAGGFYGTTYYARGGTVFAFGASGLSTLHAFNSVPGQGTQPNSLIQASDGNLYGTTASGPGSEFGTLFRLAPDGSTFATLKAYSGKHPAQGIIPQGIIEGTDHNFYGVVGQGGTTASLGSIFQLSPSGQYKTLHTFRPSDGGILLAGLIQASDGNFYGVTSMGGDPQHCMSSFVPGCGTIFRISSSGAFQVLHRFRFSDGASPYAELFQAADGFLYGSTYGGGPSVTCPGSPKGLGCGTVFRISLEGRFSTLYDFGGADGANPGAQLTQGLDGNLYGTTDRGGSHSAGTIFSIALPVQ